MIAFHERHPCDHPLVAGQRVGLGAELGQAKAFADALDPTRPKTFHDQAYGGYNNLGSSDMAVANYPLSRAAGARAGPGFRPAASLRRVLST